MDNQKDFSADVAISCIANQLVALSIILSDNEDACKPSDNVLGESLYGIALHLESIVARMN